MSKKSKKEPKSVFNLNCSDLLFNETFEKKFPKYQVYFPNSEGKFEKFYETCKFLNACAYAYGVGKFRITSDTGFYYEFNPDKYSEKDIKKAGYLEAFDFFVHNVLTSYELNLWKIMLREEDFECQIAN